MSAFVGDFRIGSIVRKMWNSNAVAGESITRATNGTISVYKDGGTTQSTAGVTDTEDFDSLTGVHLVAVDTSADGTFYSAGSDFEVVLSASTIDGKVINGTLFSFSLENRSALMPTTAGRKLTVSAGGVANANLAEILGTALTETAGLLAGGFKKFFNIASPTGTMDALGTQAKADVNAEALDVLATDTFAEPVTVPAATSTLKDKINYIFTRLRNKREQTATVETIYQDDTSTVYATASKSDDGTTLTKGEDTTA